MRIRAWIRAAFGLSKSESNGFLLLLPIMLVIVAAEPMYEAWITSGKPDQILDRARLDSLVATWQWNDIDTIGIKRELFAFDPNVATQQQLEALGIDGRTAARIVNYRNKGGQFRSKKDLGKMYGIDSSTFAALIPFISLPDQVQPKKFARDTLHKTSQRQTLASFDLNTADTTQLKSIYGIGSGISKRIIKYRESLGGFISHDQLKAVWGLDSAVVKRLIGRSFISPEFVPVQLDLNRCSEEELAAHPLIRYRLARAIVTYRFQHGKFTSVDDLQKIAAIDEQAFVRIKPYLRLE